MNIFYSPFIIVLGSFFVAIVAIAGGIWSQVHSRRTRAEERMTMIARGMPIADIEKLLGAGAEEDPRPTKDPLRSLANARRAGIILVSTAVGLLLFFLILAEIIGVRAILAGAASSLIPLAIGIGFFIDYHLQKRELSRFGLEVGSESPDAGPR
jgi:Flp pilus assembly protein TadB